MEWLFLVRSFRFKLKDTMSWLTGIGRVLFAVAMVGFGIQQFIYTGFLAGVELVPEWIPGHTFWAYCTGAVLIGAGVSMGIRKRGRLAASLVGLLFFVCVLVMHGSRIAEIFRDAVERTRAFETLALGGGALLLASTLRPENARFDNATRNAVDAARFLVSISMAVFGLDHLQAARFVAGLVPAWIPWHMFWVYFTAFGFFAAAVSMATRKLATLVEGSLGLMFLLWVVVLHGPRVAMHLRNGDEWNSAFVALALGGAAFAAAEALQREDQPDTKLPHTRDKGVYA